MSHEAMNWALQVRGLSSTEQVVLIRLAFRHNPKHGCFPSVPTIAEDSGIHVSTVRRIIKALEKKGHLQINRGGKANEARQSNRYSFAFEVQGTSLAGCDSYPSQRAHPPLAGCDPYPSQNAHPPLAECDPKEVRERSNRKEVSERGAVAPSRAKEDLQRKGNSVVPLHRLRIIPEDWEPSEKMRKALLSEGYRASQISFEAVRMRDYSASHGKKYSDFEATFRNWMRKVKPEGNEATRESHEEWRNRMRRQMNDAAQGMI